MCDLIVIGGLGVDIRTQVPVLPLPAADSLTVPPIELRIGNTGSGVALAAHALGLRVAVVDVLGADPAGDVLHQRRVVDDEPVAGTDGVDVDAGVLEW